MKIEKMKQLVKRLPNDGLYELHEILIDEMNSRKANSRTIKSVPESLNSFCEKTLPKELKNGTHS